MRLIRTIKQWTDGFSTVNNMVEELQVIFEFSEAGEATDAEVESHFTEARTAIEDLETKNMLRREEDRLGAVLKINAGAGGTESNDWADMLMRMYLRWAEKHKYTVREASFLPGEDVGVTT